MSISIYIEPISKVNELIAELLINEFNINELDVQNYFEKVIKTHFENLKENIYLLAETNYVDRVYRDSYYHYYSSKQIKYNRDSIRISLFENKIDASDFWAIDKHDDLQKKYLGFIILRPTEPFFIGRSVISPKALKINHFICCSSRFKSSVNGQKFYVDGFPHSSQDTETISCAETSLWAIMEYFSNKYSNYKSVLPSKIIETLNQISFERLIPSKGLNISQMSFALKEFGHETRIYSKSEFKDSFDDLISCYIESGIPLIIAMENRKHGGNIGHALLAVGHEIVNDIQIDNMIPSFVDRNKNIIIYDNDTIKKDFIFIDDNHPIYQKAKLETPAKHYPYPEWHNCEITFFIVPLYPKIYLDAFEAKNYIKRFLLDGPEPLNQNSEILLRFYIATSRSFKDNIAKNNTIPEDLKAILIETSMPKFIWVSEISTKELMKQKKAEGMVILDATEANIYNNKPLIIALYQNKIITFEEKTGKLQKKVLSLPTFKIFEHNLNDFKL